MSRNDLSKEVKECLSTVDTILFLDDTIEEGLCKLRQNKTSDNIVYFYVVDGSRNLVGVVPARKLLLTEPTMPISQIVHKDLVRLKENDSLGKALELFEKHKLLALPVVNDEGLFLGAIDLKSYVDDHTVHQKDLFQALGYTLEESKKKSLFGNYLTRMPWLFCNMFSGIICAIISRIHQEVLSEFLLFAFFIPLVLTLSESVSMQSMTQSLHFLRSPKLSWFTSFKKILSETKLVILIAISSGIIIGLVSLLWKDGPLPSFTIGIGITLSVIASSLFGISMPLLFHKIRLDPKIASGPVVLMIADILTTLFYLSLASWWLL